MFPGPHLDPSQIFVAVPLFLCIVVIMFPFTNLRRMIALPVTGTTPGSQIALDPLTADAKTLAAHLGLGRVTSVELVETSLDMIQKHDGYLHAMLSIVQRDKLKETAEALDRERQQGKLRGPLHGIPIVVKVGEAFRLFVALLIVLG